MTRNSLVLFCKVALIRLATLLFISIAGAAQAEDLIECDKNTCSEVGEHYFATDEIDKGVSAYIKGCDLGEAESCYSIATLYFEEYVIEGGFTKAITYYEKGCKLNHIDSCTDLADEYDEQGDYVNSVIFYGAACKLDSAYGCHLQAWNLANDTTPIDLKQATALYAKGCDLGFGGSCNNLAYDLMGYDEEPNPYTPLDYVKGLELMTLACDTYGLANSCMSLSYAHEEGHGTKKSLKKSLSYAIKACEELDDNDADGCLQAGIAYDDGYGVKQDKEQAHQYYLKACELQSSAACWNLGINYKHGIGVKQSSQKARQYYQLACDFGDDDGCIKVSE